MKVSSKITISQNKMNHLTDLAVRALEQTAEYLHTEVVQAQIVPRMDGTLQGEAFFVDRSNSSKGRVSLVHSTPYARRLYFHPEYNFHKEPWNEYVVTKDGKKRRFQSQEAAKLYAGEDGKISCLTHDGNPNAKGLWFDDWKPGGASAKDLEEALAELYRRLIRI